MLMEVLVWKSMMMEVTTTTMITTSIPVKYDYVATRGRNLKPSNGTVTVVVTVKRSVMMTLKLTMTTTM